MRHQKNHVILGRKKAARRSLFANLAESLILHEKITTTKAKAKALRPYVEKLITTAKENNLTSRRALMKDLYTKNSIDKMLEVIGPRYIDRKGGYTRITLISSTRVGDGAETAVIELV